MAEYREALFGQDLLLFRYHSLALARLPAEEYVGASPLGAALSALMSQEKTRDRALRKASMLELVVGSGLDEALKYLLVNVIETYFELSGEDAERYRHLVSRKEYRAVQEVEFTWADKLIEKGRVEGREEGRVEGREAGVVEGMRRMLLKQLTAKFGELSDKITERVRSMSEVELESVLDRVLAAATLDELDLGD